MSDTTQVLSAALEALDAIVRREDYYVRMFGGTHEYECVSCNRSSTADHKTGCPWIAIEKWVHRTGWADEVADG